MSALSRVFASLTVALLLAALPNPAAADRCPCGDLLLPYFEIALPAAPDEPAFALRTATLAIGNSGFHGETVILTVWTNWGIPVLTTTVEVPEHGVFTANLRDWLHEGRLPDRRLSVEELTHLQAALTGVPSPRNGLYYGTAMAPHRAVGWVTASLGGPSTRPVLWGDFFAIDPVEEDAAGESLVRLVQDDSGELCRRHMVRFLEGGGFDGHTRFLIWSGVRGTPSADPAPSFPRPTLSCRAYDEGGNLLRTFHRPMLATEALPAAELGLSEPFGWLECDTGTMAFMATQHEAHYRFDLALRSFCQARLGSGPGPGPGPGEAGISLQKRTAGEDADTPPGPTLEVGATVTWEYEVTNTGEVALLGVTVVDDPPADVLCPVSDLQPGETMTCTATGTVAQGLFHNLATATASTGDDPPVEVEASDPSHYFGEVPGQLAVDLEKATNGVDADTPPGPTLVAGQPVVWTYVVTNTGEIPLTTLSLVDAPPVAIQCPRVSLGPGQSVTCTAQGTVVQGPYSNLATVTGVADDGRQVQATDPSHYVGEEPGVAAVSLEKSTNGEDADEPPGPTLQAGDTVTWHYVVTNTGEVALSGIQVVDSPPQQIGCPGSALSPGGSMTCTATAVAVGGPYENLATVTAVATTGNAVQASDPSHYTGEAPPPPPDGDEGCTPGYWKNHACSWPPTGYSPDQAVDGVFPSAASWPALADATLVQALDFGGGAGAEGAAQILLRAGVAALLNAAHPDVAYPRSEGSVLSDVDAALANGSRDGMLLLAAQLDLDNNLGCPLSCVELRVTGVR